MNKLVWIPVERETLRQEIKEFRKNLQEYFEPTPVFLTPAQTLYSSSVTLGKPLQILSSRTFL